MCIWKKYGRLKMNMLICNFVFIAFMDVVLANETTIVQGVTLANVQINAFLDDLNYIRLNLSWTQIRGDTDRVSMRFKNNEDCNPIYDIDTFSLRYNNFLIVPSMDLERPADYLIHGCKYEITIEDRHLHSQKLYYEVPECVENKCRCKDTRNSPYKLKKIIPLADSKYHIEWKKDSQENMTVSDVYYQRKNDTMRTFITDTYIIHEKNGIIIPLPDLREEVFYRITVKFIDDYKECIYFSSINFKVPGRAKLLPVFAVLIFIIVSILFVFLLVIRYSRKRRNKLGNYLSCFGFDRNSDNYITRAVSFTNFRVLQNSQYTPLEFLLQSNKYDHYEFPRNKVVLKELIDEGAFGKVFYGQAFEIGKSPGYTMVAVKQLREGALPEEVEDFRNEIDTLKKIGVHQNIVELLGCVTMDEPLLMIMELVPCGSLKKYLLDLRKKWTKMRAGKFVFPDVSDCSYIQPDELLHARTLKVGDGSNKRMRQSSESAKPPQTPTSLSSNRLPSSADTESTSLDSEPSTPSINESSRSVEPVLDHTELQQFAFQIANGMKHLEEIKITHRDLAARNVLITSNKTLKISDFGMSRSGCYVSIKTKKQPLRWMAIEAIEERKCSSKSDVWSFGVVLWEIGTLGGFPYKSTPDALVLLSLKSGKRLERPGICTDELYSLMLKCWNENPDERPPFHQLLELLDVRKRKVYVDFIEISPKYVFPPIKEVCETPQEEPR